MNNPALDENSIALNQFVTLQMMEKNIDEKTSNGLYIQDMDKSENYRVVKGRVVSVGPKALELGISPGDVVLYDKHSAYATSYYRNGSRRDGEIVITDMVNIITKVNTGETVQ